MLSVLATAAKYMAGTNIFTPVFMTTGKNSKRRIEALEGTTVTKEQQAKKGTAGKAGTASKDRGGRKRMAEDCNLKGHLGKVDIIQCKSEYFSSTLLYCF